MKSRGVAAAAIALVLAGCASRSHWPAWIALTPSFDASGKAGYSAIENAYRTGVRQRTIGLECCQYVESRFVKGEENENWGIGVGLFVLFDDALLKDLVALVRHRDFDYVIEYLRDWKYPYDEISMPPLALMPECEEYLRGFGMRGKKLKRQLDAASLDRDRMAAILGESRGYVRISGVVVEQHGWASQGRIDMADEFDMPPSIEPAYLLSNQRFVLENDRGEVFEPVRVRPGRTGWYRHYWSLVEVKDTYSEKTSSYAWEVYQYRAVTLLFPREAMAGAKWVRLRMSHAQWGYSDYREEFPGPGGDLLSKYTLYRDTCGIWRTGSYTFR